jgi:hypothetical protein
LARHKLLNLVKKALFLTKSQNFRDRELTDQVLQDDRLALQSRPGIFSRTDAEDLVTVYQEDSVDLTAAENLDVLAGNSFLPADRFHNIFHFPSGLSFDFIFQGVLSISTQ